MNNQDIPHLTSRKKSEIPIWRDERYLRAIAQIVSAILVIGLVIFIIFNFFNAAQKRGLTLGFDFLSEAAGFPITESTINYDPSLSFGYAFLAGIINTLRVCIIGIILATILGTVIGIARLSSNWLVNRIALVYIEFHRNIPLLVLLFLWFFAVFQKIPSVDQSIAIQGLIYINQRGVYMTWFRLSPTGGTWLIFLALGILLAFIAWIILFHIRETTGKSTYFVGVSLSLLILIPLIGWYVVGETPLVLDIPYLERYNFTGGLRLTPEFSALLIGLVMYTAAFIAEVVRAGIQAVNRGQLEAAQAVGLKPFQVLGLVIIPQALRVIIPPLISQYLNLTKNSSLALAIGYPDLFNVGRIMINQAGRAVPVFSMIMVSYLIMSLITSVTLNIYNRRIQFVER
jgi:general L-amino acid transport system permease protein